jgi:hypothetical protein
MADRPRDGLKVTQRLRVQTAVGPTQTIVTTATTEQRTVHETDRAPDPSVARHLSFALKHEGVHLETLSRLFAAVPAPKIETWNRHEPTGQYARRAGFLCELLTSKHLDIADSTRGNYRPASDAELELMSTTPVNNAPLGILKLDMAREIYGCQMMRHK